MFARSRYISWARAFYGKIPHDLAASGIPLVSHAELGLPGELDDPRGHDRLKAAIARYNDVPEHEVIATLGTTQAVWLAYVSLLSPDDHILVEDPGYEPLWRAAEGSGVTVHRFTRSRASEYALDPANIEQAMTSRTRAVVVSNLHNPTGVRADDDALRTIAALCATRRAHLIVDEVYAPFDALTDGSGVWHGSARKLASNVITVGSLTKCYGLGPHRIGWVLGPRDVIERGENAIITTCGSLPLQHANIGAHAFGRIEDLSNRARGLITGRRAQVEAWVSKQKELTWSAPTSGLYGFALHEKPDDLLPLLETGAREHGVLAAAGIFFGVPNGFRLSWASLGGSALDHGLAQLRKVLSS